MHWTSWRKLGEVSVDLDLHKGTTKGNYQRLQSYRNVTSFSMLTELHRCPRRFQLIKARAATGGARVENLDFAFGHSVGAGIQAALLGGEEAGIFSAFLAWDVRYDAVLSKKNHPVKSSWQATLAVMKFAEFRNEHLYDWEVWTTPDGKPAIELSIEVDFENGYKHYCHIDAILINRVSGKLAVLENKTDGWSSIDEAKYANSSQALGYAAVVDMLADRTSFEVFYCIYGTTAQEWELLPFHKTTSLKAEWIADTQLDHSTIETYHKLQFYPKRGESCFDFGRRCEFFGICNLTAAVATPLTLAANESAEAVDYSFTVSQLRANQHSRVDGPESPSASMESID
jgi:hypothetical protein